MAKVVSMLMWVKVACQSQAQTTIRNERKESVPQMNARLRKYGIIGGRAC
jgi:hypothetical protein